MKTGEVFEVLIIDDNHNGNGIGRVFDVPVFVPRTVKDDLVKVEIIKVNKKYALGEVVSFVKKNEVKVKCPYYDKCGGCNLLHISYDRELYLKQKYISKLFGIDDVKINSFDRYNYRNKVVFHVKEGVLGFYTNKSNSVVKIDKCLLLDVEINKFVNTLKEIDLKGIKEITIRKGEGLLVSVVGKVSNEFKDFVINYSGVVSFYVNNELIYGSDYLETVFGDFNFVLNNNSFFRVNTECAISLYDKIKEYICTSKRALDLYCGALTIGIYVSDICEEVLGFEINEDSVKCGDINIINNSITNCNIHLGDSSKFTGDFDVVIVDPPRAGLSMGVINNLLDMKPEKIIYVSCNPSTLKRDIELLCDYKLSKMEIFNMFPGTKHIECVSLLSRNN